MGVSGLWDLIQHTAETRSLTHLAVVDGFQKNESGLRGYRIGIDASIWFFHAKYSREGENPELRLMFFRLAKLLSEPVLPIFVFDGPKRPSWKRGVNINKKPHWMVHGVKTMIAAFGFQWRQAPGEAEAELAYLNRVGVIDGVLSDDVDNFLFGAKLVIRNPGRGLTGNISNPALNAEGRDDGNHVRIFDSHKIHKDSSLELTRAGFILIGLLSGGDYEEKDVPGSKLPGCGIQTAHALARAGFGEELVNAYNELASSPSEFQSYLFEWRKALKAELRTNSRGLLGRKQGKLADSVPDAFPNLKVLKAYVQPVTSESEAFASGMFSHLKSIPPPKIDWTSEHSLAALARFCEEKFEWGTREVIPKRFRSLMWHGSVVRILRRAVLDEDRGVKGWKDGRVRSSEKPRGESPEDLKSRMTDVPKTPTKTRKGKDGEDTRGGGAVGTPSKMITKYFSEVTLDSPQKRQSSPLKQTTTGTFSDSSGTDDEHDKTDDVHPLISRISASTSKHPQTDYMLEYRIEIDPHQLIHLTQSGIEGVREEPEEGGDSDSEAGAQSGEGSGDDGKKRKSKKVDHFSLHRVWVPGLMLAAVEGDLVSVFERAEDVKREKKVGRGKGKAKARTLPEPGEPKGKDKAPMKRTKSAPASSSTKGGKGKGSKKVPESDDEDEVENFDLSAVSDASNSDTDLRHPGTSQNSSRATSVSIPTSAAGSSRSRAPSTSTSSRPVSSALSDADKTPVKSTSKTKQTLLDILASAAPSPFDSDDPFNQPEPSTSRAHQSKSKAPTSSKAKTGSKSLQPAEMDSKATTTTTTKSKGRSRARVESKVNTSDWEDLFPSVPKKSLAPVASSSYSYSSSSPPPAKGKSKSAASPATSKSKRRPVLSDSENEGEEGNTSADGGFNRDLSPSSAPPPPKSPKRDRTQMSPKKAISRQAHGDVLNAFYRRLGYDQDAESSDDNGNDLHPDKLFAKGKAKGSLGGKEVERERSTSPTPRKGSSSVLTSLSKKPIARGDTPTKAVAKPKSKSKVVVIDLSSDSESGEEARPSVTRAPTSGAKGSGLSNPMLGLTSTGKLFTGPAVSAATSMGTSEPLSHKVVVPTKTKSAHTQGSLGMRTVKGNSKISAGNKPKPKRVASAVLDVIDLTTP